MMILHKQPTFCVLRICTCLLVVSRSEVVDHARQSQHQLKLQTSRQTPMSSGDSELIATRNARRAKHKVLLASVFVCFFLKVVGLLSSSCYLRHEDYLMPNVYLLGCMEQQFSAVLCCTADVFFFF